MKKYERVFETIRNEGIKTLCIKILDWAKMYRRLLFFVRDYSKETLIEPDVKLHVETRLLKENEVDMYTLHHPGVNASEIIKRLKEGELCFVSIHDGVFIAHTWSAFNQACCEYLDCFLSFPTDTVYNYDAFVSPDYRGHRIFPAQYLYQMKYLLKNGYFRTISFVLPENSAGIKHLKRTGGKDIGIIGYVKVGHWKKYFCKMKPEYLDKQAISWKRNKGTLSANPTVIFVRNE